jgi:hypothetical protein
MGIYQGDVKIRTAIVLALEEMRKNLWLLDDIFSDLLNDEYLREYGQKEIDRAKEWFKNNKISVLHKYRPDSQDYPCVTIHMAPSKEDDREATLSDQSPFVEEFSPEKIDKKIPYVVKPFTPAGYAAGVLTAPADLDNVTPGMLVVDPDTGNAYEIEEVTGARTLKIKDSPAIAAQKLGVIPQYRVWRARRERAAFRQTYQIGCHVHGDPGQLLWLHDIVLYALLRYRETMIAGRCFQISSLESSDMMEEDLSGSAAGERAYKRYISLSGLVQQSWIKSPKRVIEIAKIGPSEGIAGGIRVLTDANTPDEAADPEKDDVWLTKQETQSFKKKTLSMKGTK